MELNTRDEQARNRQLTTEKLGIVATAQQNAQMDVYNIEGYSHVITKTPLGGDMIVYKVNSNQGEVS